MDQPDLFSSHPIRMNVPAVMKPRLTTQCQAILERLTWGPATNRELSALALKYTNRVSELNKAGYRITCYDHNRRTGLAWYRLEA